MEPLNFCRQMLRSFESDRMGHSDTYPPTDHRLKGMSHASALSKLSMKFTLPNGGNYIEDKNFRAIEGQKLSLPYEYIALEWIDSYWRKGMKTILFANQTEDFIVFSDAYFDVYEDRRESHWFYEFFEHKIPRIGFLSSEQDSYTNEYGKLVVFTSWSNQRISEYTPNANILAGFLNVISCSNVKVEKRTPKKARKLKFAIPFDEYHFLTIDCPKRAKTHSGVNESDRRHPREHLRRGHIRRLENGNRIWVNSTVVNHGVGGKITKDYGVRDPRSKMIDALKK